MTKGPRRRGAGFGERLDRDEEAAEENQHRPIDAAPHPLRLGAVNDEQRPEPAERGERKRRACRVENDRREDHRDRERGPNREERLRWGRNVDRLRARGSSPKRRPTRRCD